MIAQSKDNQVVADCKVAATEKGWHIVGNFYADLTISDENNDKIPIGKEREQINTAFVEALPCFRITHEAGQNNGGDRCSNLFKFGERLAVPCNSDQLAKYVWSLSSIICL